MSSFGKPSGILGAAPGFIQRLVGGMQGSCQLQPHLTHLVIHHTPNTKKSVISSRFPLAFRLNSMRAGQGDDGHLWTWVLLNTKICSWSQQRTCPMLNTPEAYMCFHWLILRRKVVEPNCQFPRIILLTSDPQNKGQLMESRIP